MRSIQQKKSDTHRAIAWVLFSTLILTHSNPAHAGFGFLGRFFKRYNGTGTEAGQTRTTMGALRGAPLNPSNDPKRVADQQRIEAERAQAQRAAAAARAGEHENAAQRAQAIQQAANGRALENKRQAQLHQDSAAQKKEEARERVRALIAAGKSLDQIKDDPALRRALGAAKMHEKSAGMQRGLGQINTQVVRVAGQRAQQHQALAGATALSTENPLQGGGAAGGKK